MTITSDYEDGRVNCPIDFTPSQHKKVVQSLINIYFGYKDVEIKDASKANEIFMYWMYKYYQDKNIEVYTEHTKDIIQTKLGDKYLYSFSVHPHNFPEDNFCDRTVGVFLEHFLERMCQDMMKTEKL